jgi:hypothetical protein
MENNNNIADLLRNVSVQYLGEGRKIVQHTKTGSYIICNSKNEVERTGVINNNPNPEIQHQKATVQRNYIDNNNALELYGLVNLITGKTSTYDDIQNNMMAAAYPSHHRYQMASQRSNNNYNNNRNAVELYELVQFIGGGNNVNGW